MTRTVIGASGLLLLSTALAQAGALDRTGQPVTIIFEEGNYVELSYGFTMPEVSGTYTDPLTTASSGNVGVDYSQVALSFKYDVTDRVSLALVIDQPFGADVDYDDADAAYPTLGSVADFYSTGVTAIGRYEFNENFSVHAGARWVEIDADLFVSAFGGLATYGAEYEPDSDLGYLVGVAYERPEIALRVALTYSSETDFSHETTYSSTLTSAGTGATTYTMPQSVNLDFRTGIAEGTAILGGVRWVDWSETSIDSPGYEDLFGTPVVEYDGDYVTYILGLGRAFSPSLLGSASVIYEDGIGGEVSNLSPYDGQVGVQVGGTYRIGNGLELTAGARYSWLGDATTNTILAEFEDNHALSLAARVGYRF